MRFGAHCYLFVDRWSDACLRVLDEARALGLTVLEIALGDDVVFDCRRTHRRAEALGLDLVVSPGGMWPERLDLSHPEPAARREALQWHRRQLRVASELGAVAYTGALYGHPGTVRRGLPSQEEHARAAAGLHDLADSAAGLGVTLALEPMSHFRTHLVNRPRQLMDLIAAADHDNLRVLLDTYHLVTEIRDYGAAVAAVGDRLWGIHACENDRGIPGGGLVPWGSFFAALRQQRFDGYVLMETYNSSVGDPPGRFAHSRGMFHDVCPDGAAFVRQGLRFLQEGLHTTA